MPVTLAFDVYGTLIDPSGVTGKLGEFVGQDAAAFGSLWRDKQIEYLFRRALMRDYENFTVCTRQALDYTCHQRGRQLSVGQRDELMAQYRALPAYPGSREALQGLREAGHRLYAFSNGVVDELEELLTRAGLAESLDGIVSVDPVRSFKPDPAVYAHCLEQAGSTAERTWLVSGNPFDVIGAARCGWNTAWLRRDPSATFDPWGIEPTAIVRDLGEFGELL